jgi:Zn-dependent oligopeptidase
MRAQIKGIRPSLALLAVALLSMAPALRAAYPVKDSEEVSGFFTQAKTESIQLKQDAEEMNSFVRSKTTWETHAAKLNQIKEHVNNVAALVTKMNAAKNTASPWQQQAIERINPLLTDLATTVGAAIVHLGKNQDRLLHQPYPDYAAANATVASDMAQLISDYVAYGEAKNRSEDLARQLEVPTD